MNTTGDVVTQRAEKETQPVVVLVVDDDKNCRVPTKIRLEKMGYVVGIAVNGADALAWIAEHGDPDVILLDLRMPVMTGNEFASRYAGPAPIVVLSGWAHEEVLARPPAATVIKPWVVDELDAAIRAAIATKKKG